jgi:hypothetical protein
MAEIQPREVPPTPPLPRDFKPDNSIPVRVKDGDDWGKIAARYHMDVRKLLIFNFNTTNPDQINYYLRANVGCNVATADGKNWMFTTSAKPGVIYVPDGLGELPKQSFAGVRLRVPYIKGTRKYSCWHDCARMIYQYKHVADLNPVSDEYRLADMKTGNAATFIKLAKELNFRSFPVPDAVTKEFLAQKLKMYGPLWAPGDWNGEDHIIVITGIGDDEVVYFNDPAWSRTGPDKSDLYWFNQHLGQVNGVSLMYLP